MLDWDKLFREIKELQVLVIGDVMLDCYWWGEVERISPEAPVPIVALNKRENRLGGAANVALNCRSLGAHVTLGSVVGDDSGGHALIKLLKDSNIDVTLLNKSKLRKTTTKTRILSRNQQMMRLDDEVSTDLVPDEEHTFLDAVLKFLQIRKPHVVILEDYNKGVLKENVIHRILDHCHTLHIPVAVDPKKKNFLSFRGATLFKPNLKEVREGLNLPPTKINGEVLEQMHATLRKNLNHGITFITLSEKGVYYHDGQEQRIIPSHIRNISDVSGAGDTVIATASIVYALTKNARLMAEVSNIAGGLVCEYAGVVPIEKNLLKAECQRLLNHI